MEPAKPITDPKTEIEELSDHLREYIDTRRELLELKLLDKVFVASASAITWGVLIFIGVMIVVLLSIGAALWIGTKTGSSFIGFFIVGGFYLLAGAILFAGREKLIRKPISDRMIDHIANDDDNEEEAEHVITDERTNHQPR